MSVKIEILDYVYGNGLSIVNVNAGNPQAGWTSLSAKSANFVGDTTNNSKFYQDISNTIISGKTYKIRLQITNYSGTGDIGFSINNSSGTSLGISPSARISSDGIVTETFTAVTSGKIRLFSKGTVTNADVKNISVIDTQDVDWKNSVVGELDVTDHTDFPLALTFQISDFKDLTSTSGDYSKSFKIPATKNNNNIFKNLYNPKFIVDNKVTDKKRCRILFNNLYSLEGLLQVDGVGGYNENPSYYNCVFFGSNLSWSNKIQESYINEIDWGSDGENIIYNKNSITPTWDYIDCDSSTSPIVYPITSYGDYNPNGTDGTIQLLDTLGEHNSTLSPSVYKGYYGFYDDFVDYGTPVPVADWRPAIFVKPTLDKIFSQLGGNSQDLGYKINSVFMQTDMFKKLVWTLPNFKYNNPDDRTIKFGYGNKFTGEGFINSILVAPTNTTTYPPPFQTTDTVLDLNDSSDFVLNSNRDNTGWDLSTGIFTIQEYGNYKVDLSNFGFFAVPTNYNGGSLGVEYVKLRVQVQTVGQTSFNTVGSSQTDSFYLAGGAINGVINDPVQNFPSIELTRYFNKDDKIRLNIQIKASTAAYPDNQLTIHLFGSSSPTSATTSDSSDALYNIDINPFNVEYGQTYNLKDVINFDYKQIDFIKGIAHAFNLQMTTNESTRTVNIEPYDSFYEPYSKAIDWTYKLDRSNLTNDKWLEADLKRNLIFKYKSDSADKRVEARSYLFDDIKDEYPYKEILPDTFKKGTSKFENPFFAGTYNAKDQDTIQNPPFDVPFSACLWTENVSPNDAARPNKGYDFLPRLLHWNSYTSAAPFNRTTKIATVQTWTSSFNTIIASINYPFPTYTNYPQATMLNRDSTTSPNLAYGNAWVRDYDDNTATYTSYKVGKGLYETYYKKMIESLKKSPRLRTVNITLQITDIVNLDFKKLIYIDGVYWRINRIIDYKPNNNQSTKVELLEWFDFANFAANAPMFGQSGENSWHNNNEGGLEDDSNNNVGL